MHRSAQVTGTHDSQGRVVGAVSWTAACEHTRLAAWRQGLPPTCICRLILILRLMSNWYISWQPPTPRLKMMGSPCRWTVSLLLLVWPALPRQHAMWQQHVQTHDSAMDLADLHGPARQAS